MTIIAHRTVRSTDRIDQGTTQVIPTQRSNQRDDRFPTNPTRPAGTRTDEELAGEAARLDPAGVAALADAIRRGTLTTASTGRPVPAPGVWPTSDMTFIGAVINDQTLTDGQKIRTMQGAKAKFLADRGATVAEQAGALNCTEEYAVQAVADFTAWAGGQLPAIVRPDGCPAWCEFDHQPVEVIPGHGAYDPSEGCHQRQIIAYGDLESLPGDFDNGRRHTSITLQTEESAPTPLVYVNLCDPDDQSGDGQESTRYTLDQAERVAQALLDAVRRGRATAPVNR